MHAWRLRRGDDSDFARLRSSAWHGTGGDAGDLFFVRLYGDEGILVQVDAGDHFRSLC